MVIQGIHEAMGLIDAIARHPEYQGSKPLRMSALESLAAAERLLIDGLRMKMPKGCRSKVWEAKSAIHANLLSMTIAKGPYTDGELVLIDDQLAKLNSLGAFMATVGDTIGSGN